MPFSRLRNLIGLDKRDIEFFKEFTGAVDESHNCKLNRMNSKYLKTALNL